MTNDTTTSLSDHLSRLVAARVSRLQREYQRDESAAVADLALLRRGVSQRPGQDVRLIGLTIAGVHPRPHELPDEPTDAERAAYAAMTLFAVHQQSQRTRSMHRADHSFGRSSRLLGRRSHAMEAVRRRFTIAATASSWDETLHHTRALIQQFRANDVPLDYGAFARDLYWIQTPGSAERVRLSWGRDFYRVDRAEDDDTSADDEADDEN